MPQCRICRRDNPPGAQRCQSCGAWLDLPAAEGAASGGEPAAASVQPPAEPPADPLEAEVLDLMRQQRKIDAIKHFRQATGTGLKESKEAVEAIARRHGVESRPGVGCTAAILFAAAALGGMIGVAARIL